MTARSWRGRAPYAPTMEVAVGFRYEPRRAAGEELDVAHLLHVSRGEGGFAPSCAEASVQMTSDGLGFVMTLPLGTTRATLRSGESVDFEVDFVN